jgi:hypothetical protein
VTPEEAEALLKVLVKKLSTQARAAKEMRDYYDGDTGQLRYASSEWSKWFEAQYEGFSDNWCLPVADATTERLTQTGFRLFGASKPDADLQRIWLANGADAESSLAFTESVVTSRGFAMVWINDDDVTTPLLTFEPADEVAVEYEPGSRRKRKAAVKVWTDGSEQHATLYVPGALWKWKRKTSTGSLTYTGRWERREVPGEEWPLPNPLGEVPIVELPNRPRLRGEPLSEIAGVAALQDAANVLWAYLFTAADFAAMPQRVILGAQLPKIPILDENGVKVGEKPVELNEAAVKRILNLESPNAKIDSWPAAQLDVFTEVIDVVVSHIANQTRTPAYYLVGGKSFANLSADAIKALDAGLVQKVGERKTYLSEALREVGRLLCLATGDEAKARLMAAGRVLWTDHQVRGEAQLADASQKLRALGFPFEWIAKRHIDDPDELAEVIAAYKAEQEATLLGDFGPKPDPIDPGDEDEEDGGDEDAAAS